MSENALVVVEQDNIPTIFKKGGLATIIKEIEGKVSDLVPDIETKKGRDEIASYAYKVARSKTYLDNLGKDYVADLKALPKEADAERKNMRETLDALRDKIRKPLDDFEAAEQYRVDKIQAKRDSILGCLNPDVDYISCIQIEEALAFVNSINIDSSFDEFVGVATTEKENVTTQLRAKKIVMADQEQKAVEAERLAEEQRAKEQAEREAKIALEAADKARQEAEGKAKAEADKAREAQATAEREAAEANERAAQAERDRIAADEQAKRDNEAALQAERDRVAAEKKAEDDATREREQDLAHKAQINNAAANSLIGVGSISTKEQAEEIIIAIVRGHVPHVSIKY